MTDKIKLAINLLWSSHAAASEFPDFKTKVIPYKEEILKNRDSVLSPFSGVHISESPGNTTLAAYNLAKGKNDEDVVFYLAAAVEILIDETK